MSKVICKNCNGEFSDELSACPYCGTMHKKTAYRNFREKISNIIDNVLGLKKQADRSISLIILSSILRGLIIVSLCISLALVLSIFRNTNYYNDKKYDEKRLNDIIWQNENISKLDEAFFKKDYDTVESLISQNYSASYNWQHYDAYYLDKTYKYIIEKEIDEYFSEYVFGQCLYYLYYPDYYVNTKKMSQEELLEYENNRAILLNKLVEKGYSETQLQNIYDLNADEYGYIQTNKLKEYIKGENNG